MYNETRGLVNSTVMCMENQEYKHVTSLWNVKRRNIIEDSLTLVEKENLLLATKLKETLESKPVDKPAGHTGDKESDYFEVLLNEDEMQELVDLLFELEAAVVPQGEGIGFEKEALQAREASRIASLVDEWNKLNAD